MSRKVLVSMVLVGVCASGCTHSTQFGATKTVVMRQAINELELEPVPGTQRDVWTEPMYDQVRTPGAIDPKGVYYRPSHWEIVEIRPGKYQKVQYPDYDGKYREPR